MGVEPIYSGNGLLGDRISSYCPSARDFSYTSIYFNEPVVVDFSYQKCTRNLYAKDSTVINTNGCCVVDSSDQSCYKELGLKDSADEELHYMNIRYLSTKEETGGISKGERKICYTAPLRRHPLYVMELLTSVAIDIAALIAIVLVGACYEYWIIYGNCSSNGIQTLLSDTPYSVNEYIMKRQDNYTIKMSKECEVSDVRSSSEKVEWYDTFPYNIITFFNKPIIKTKERTIKSIRGRIGHNR